MKNSNKFSIKVPGHEAVEVDLSDVEDDENMAIDDIRGRMIANIEVSNKKPTRIFVNIPSRIESDIPGWYAEVDEFYQIYPLTCKMK